MKLIFFSFVITMFFSGCKTYSINTEELVAVQISPQPSMRQGGQAQDPILARDYYVAKNALDKAVQANDLATIRLGLKGFSFQIRKEVIEEIVRRNDISFVPDLADALEANQGCLSGGSETDFYQKDLSGTIVSALKKFTKLKFEYFKTPSGSYCGDEKAATAIKRILHESRNWWSNRK